VPESLRSASTQAFVRGAACSASDAAAATQHDRQVRGLARCNFGCRSGAKRSVDVSYLPSALRMAPGSCPTLWLSALWSSGGDAVGVRGRCSVSAGPADAAFGCAPEPSCALGGASTRLAAAHGGVGREALVATSTFAPWRPSGALFPRAVRGWMAPCKASTPDHYCVAGITLVGVYRPVNVAGCCYARHWAGVYRARAPHANLGYRAPCVRDVQGGGRLFLTCWAASARPLLHGAAGPGPS